MLQIHKMEIVLPPVFKYITLLFLLFLPQCALHQPIVRLLNDTWGRTDSDTSLPSISFPHSTHLTSVAFHNNIWKETISSELNIHFHSYLKKLFQQWGKETLMHVKCTSRSTSYFVFGRLHERFESQPEVVRCFHQVLRGTDKDFINWTSHRPWRLHQRTTLWRGGTERKADCC